MKASAMSSMGLTTFISCFIVFSLNLEQTRCFNIHEDDVTIFRGESGSFFGYSLRQHENSQGKWILVGAPNSSSVHQSSLKSPGALFKCAVNDGNPRQSCEQVAVDSNGNEDKLDSSYGYGRYIVDVKDNQWLGVSLDRRQGGPGQPGQIVVCGHKWMRRSNSNGNFNWDFNQFMYGSCYTIDSELQTRGEPLQPCLEVGPEVSQGIQWHGWCQAGASAHYTVDGTLLLGAPSDIAWRGTVISLNNANDPVIAPWNKWFPGGESGREAYVGYSLSSGSFSSPTANEGVTGAPRAYEVGKVFIFDVNTFDVKIELFGERVNTYFGCSVLAVDLNSDDYSDLLVGAPLYTDKMDEGRVYVYVNDKQGNLRLMNGRLRGNNAFGARFGSAIANVGDLNQDGSTDVAIGAPFEGDGSGAVYIYHGSHNGIGTKYAQRLGGTSVMAGIASFGSSITGGMDMDGNGYPDIVIGAHQSDSTVYYRSKPVVSVAMSLKISPEVLKHETRNITECSLHGSPVTCVKIEVCLVYIGHQVAVERGFNYDVSADVLRTEQGLPSRFFFTQNFDGSDNSVVTGRIELRREQQKCVEHTAYLKVDVRDFLNIVQFKSTYNLYDTIDETTRLPYSIDPTNTRVVTKEAAFARNCGDDDICQTDLQVTSSLEARSQDGVLYLGDDKFVDVNVKITNNEEEAHQAFLSVWYPSDVVYVRYETVVGGLLPCELYQDDQIRCRLGNPMEANSEVHFKLRFDTSLLNGNREYLNFTLEVKTASEEKNGSLHDNIAEPSIPVKVLADIIVRGSSTPEQLIYDVQKTDGDSLSSYLKHVIETLKQIEDKVPSFTSVVGDEANNQTENDVMGKDHGLNKTEAKTIDESIIGPSLVLILEASNLGPGSIPMSSYVNISVPWRLNNGDWLLYLRGIKAKDGISDCNIHNILQNQSVSIKEHYKRGRDATYETNNDHAKLLPFSYDSDVFSATCGSVTCVTITCKVGPINAADSVVFELEALLWKHTFLQHEISLAELTADVSVKVIDPTGRFAQPDNHIQDETKITTSIIGARRLKSKPIPSWIIVVSTVGGVLVLIIIILMLAKCGFFRRMSQEDMNKLLDEKYEVKQDENAMKSSKSED